MNFSFKVLDRSDHRQVYMQQCHKVNKNGGLPGVFLEFDVDFGPTPGDIWVVLIQSSQIGICNGLLCSGLPKYSSTIFIYCYMHLPG